MTRRICLSVANSIYDPLGIAIPITIKLKHGMRELFNPDLDLTWDTPLPDQLQEEWKNKIRMLGQTPQVEFNRCLRPDNSTDNYSIVVYFDGSDAAFSCVLYAVWHMPDGTNQARFITAKAKIGQESEKSTPRRELNGGVLATRATVRVVTTLEKKPDSVIILSDSETILAAREKSTGFFTEYFSNRVSELWDNKTKIEEFCPVEDWYHVSSEDNAADLPSRVDATAEDIKLNSTW